MQSILSSLAIQDPDERFVMRSRVEVAAILRQLAADHSLISIGADPARDFVLTTLLRVNAEADELILDGAREPSSNRRLAEAPQLLAITEHRRVKVEFLLGPALLIDFEGAPALRTHLPARLIRRERRQFYRARVPLSTPLAVKFHVIAERPETEVQMRVLDISLGGIGLVSHTTHFSLRPGVVIPDFKLALPDVGAIASDLEVKSSFSMTLGSGARANRACCKFLTLSARHAALIQRYINQLEAERKRHT